MKKLIVAFLACASAYATPAFAGMPAELQQMQTEILSPTVQLDMNCSGQIIYSDVAKEGGIETYVLTAKHCVKDTTNKDELFVDVPTFDAKGSQVATQRFYVSIEAQAYSVDVALLKLKDTRTFFRNVVKLAPLNVELYQGEQTWAVGYPAAAARTISVGLLGPLQREDFGMGNGLHEYYRATPDIAPGSSGGALYHKNSDGHYELIGTATGMYSGFNFIAFWTPIGDVQSFLKAQESSLYNKLFKPAPRYLVGAK